MLYGLIFFKFKKTVFIFSYLFQKQKNLKSQLSSKKQQHSSHYNLLRLNGPKDILSSIISKYISSYRTYWTPYFASLFFHCSRFLFQIVIFYLLVAMPSLVAQMVKNWSVMGETWVQSLGGEDGEGNGNSLQYSCLENSMDRGNWRATLHGIIKS